jgi:hypothetical protein
VINTTFNLFYMYIIDLYNLELYTKNYGGQEVEEKLHMGGGEVAEQENFEYHWSRAQGTCFVMGAGLITEPSGPKHAADRQ